MKKTTQNKNSFLLFFKKFIIKNQAILISALIGAIIFILTYGIQVLDPQNDNWLLSGGDLSQHYIGWQAYRNSSWKFPIGMTDQLAYPNESSIIFTDSIPIFAVFFKFLSPILPGTFQYFGLWGIMCYMLSAIFGALILKKFFKKDHQVVIGASFFVLSFPMTQRMFGHTALGGQWLILLALYIFFCHKDFNFKQSIIAWIVVAFLTASVHLYFVIMAGFILVGYIVAELMDKKLDFKCRIKNSCLYLVAFCMTVLFVLSILGGFSSNSYTAGGLGLYSMNLNSFYNSSGLGFFLAPRDTTAGNYEGMCYLGLGVIFLLIVTISNILGKKHYFKEHLNEVIPLLVIFTITFIFAVSPSISFENNIIFNYESYLPNKIIEIWSVFRSSGRMGWVLVYILYIVAIIADYKIIPSKTKTIFLCSMLAIQFVDIAPFMITRNNEIASHQSFTNNINCDDFDGIMRKLNLKHIVYTYDVTNYDFAICAVQQKYTVSNFYFARNGLPIQDTINSALKNPSEDTVIIFKNEELEKVKQSYAISEKIKYYSFNDNYTFGITKDL